MTPEQTGLRFKVTLAGRLSIDGEDRDALVLEADLATIKAGAMHFGGEVVLIPADQYEDQAAEIARLRDVGAGLLAVLDATSRKLSKHMLIVRRAQADALALPARLQGGEDD